MKFDPNSNPPCFSNPEEQVSIERNARVRLKIVGTRVDATEIVGDYALPLGVVYLETERHRMRPFHLLSVRDRCVDSLYYAGRSSALLTLGHTGTIREDFLGLIEA